MEAGADRDRHLTTPLLWFLAFLVGALFVLALLLVFSAKDAGASVVGGEPPVPLPGPVGGVVGTVDQTVDQTLDQTVTPQPGAGPVPAAPVPASPDPLVPEPLPTVTAPIDPVLQAVQPVLDAAQPVVPIAQPALDTVQPVLGVAQPVLGVAQPVLGVAQPVLGVVQPVLTIPDHLTGTILPETEPLGPAVVGILAGVPPSLPPLPLAGAPTGLLPPALLLTATTPSPIGTSTGTAPPLASPSPATDAVPASPFDGAPASLTTVRLGTRGLTSSPAPASDAPALGVPEPALPPGSPAPFPSTTGATPSFDLGSSLHVLLDAIAVAFSAIFGMRARRLLQFGAVTPRFAFVSLIERPG